MKFNPNGESFTKSSDYANAEMMKSYDESSYAWKPSDDGVLRITKSSLGDFNWCPYQYYLTKILGHRGQETEHMIKGTNVHDVCEYFWKNVDSVLPEVLDLIEEEKHLLGYEKLKTVIPKPPSPYMYGEDAIIDTWLRWQWDRLLVTKGKDWKPVGNEVEGHARIEVEVDGKSYPVHLKGFIDRIFSDSEGGFVLMELKTGKWNPKKATSMRTEMQFYKMLLEEGNMEEFLPVTHWAWEFPDGDVRNGTKKEWEIEEIGTRKTKYAPRTVNNRVKKLVEAHVKNEFPPIHKDTCKSYCRHENLCSWCDFMDLCPSWNGGIKI